MRAEISELHNRLKATMIYVTHDQVEAMTMGDKIVVMRDGKVQQIGSPLYLYNHPVNRFVAGFIGSPPMNFLSVKIEEKNGGVVADEGSFEVVPTKAQQERLKAYVGKEVAFGIRPEDLHYQATPAEESNMRMNVTVREPLGAETHLHLATKSQALVAKVGPDIAIQLGDAINFKPDMGKAHFFDRETELSICDDAMQVEGA